MFFVSNPLLLIIPWLIGSIWIFLFLWKSKSLHVREKWLLLFSVLPILSNWIVPAFLGLNFGDYRFYHLITLITTLPIILWLILLLLKNMASGSFSVPSAFFYEKLLPFFVLLSLISLVRGYLLGNSIKYIVSDSYKWLAFPIFYWFCFKIISIERTLLLINEFFRINLYLLLISLFFISWVSIARTPQKLSISGFDIIFPILLMSILRTRTKINFDFIFFRISKKKLTLMVFLAGAALLLSFERAHWVTFLISIIPFLAVYGYRFSFFKAFKYFMLLCLSLSLVVLTIFILNTSKTSALRQIAEVAIGRMSDGIRQIFYKAPQVLRGDIDPTERAGSLDTRVAEVVDAWDYMKTQDDWVPFIIGMGDGAQYPTHVLTAETSAWTEEKSGWNHNFHFSLMGIFFTKGTIGLTLITLFLAALFSVSLRSTKRKFRNKNNEYVEIYFSYFLTFILSFILYFTGGALFYDFTFILYTALFGKLIRFQRLQIVSSTQTG